MRDQSLECDQQRGWTIESFPLCSADGASLLKTGHLLILLFFFFSQEEHVVLK